MENFLFFIGIVALIGGGVQMLRGYIPLMALYGAGQERIGSNGAPHAMRVLGGFVIMFVAFAFLLIVGS